MNCAVIGGGGFLGSHLSEALLKLGHKIVVLDRPNSQHLDTLAKLGATIVEGDFLVGEVVTQALHEADVVYHFACTTVPKTSNEDPLYDVETNLKGAISLFQAALDAGVKKVVFASSGGTVYGTPKQIPITEDHPTDPISSYGIVKLATEKYLHLFWTLYGLNYCILRVSNAYGERQSPNPAQGVVAAIIEKSLRHEAINVWGDGTVIRDYIHVSDVTNAFVKAAEYQGPVTVFNISNAHGHSVNDIIGMVTKYCGQPIQVVHSRDLASDVRVSILDNSRAKLYLDWKPEVKLDDGIERTINYMRDHQNPPAQLSKSQRC